MKTRSATITTARNFALFTLAVLLTGSKKLLLPSLVATFVAAQALAQGGTWTTIAPMPTAVLQASGVAFDGKFYVIDGYGSGSPQNVPPQVYDPLTNSWSFKAGDPVDRAEAVAGVINNRIYVAEGWIHSDSNNSTTALEIYDPAADSWAAGAPSLVARGDSAAAVIGGKLYITGGSTYWQNAGIATLEIYDPNANTWSTGAPIPVAPKRAVGAALNGKFYVVGGGVGGNPFPATANVYIYDPTSNTWTSGAPMPSPRIYAGGGVINGKLYITGGSSADGTDNPVVVYDPIMDSWSAAAAEPTPRSGAAAAVVGCKLNVEVASARKVQPAPPARKALPGSVWFRALISSCHRAPPRRPGSPRSARAVSNSKISAAKIRMSPSTFFGRIRTRSRRFWNFVLPIP
jgi:N-acetylneuraminic acid mutarotase